MKRLLLIVIVCIWHLYCVGTINYEQITIVKERSIKKRSMNCFVTRVYDNNNVAYIVKQYKHGAFSLIAATPICELVALEMGHSVGVKLNVATLIPAGVAFEGKDKTMCATLHTFIEGIRCDAYKAQLPSHFSIAQTEKEGLHRNIILSMAFHKDLPPLVALDTFVGNIDRGTYNYFYCADTDSFMGIDLGGAFSYNLAEAAFQAITNYTYDTTVIFSEVEINGLLSYYYTLRALWQTYEPSVTYRKLEKYATDSRLFDTALFPLKVQRKWVRFLERCKKNIRQSYYSMHSLLCALEDLFNQNGVHYEGLCK